MKVYPIQATEALSGAPLNSLGKAATEAAARALLDHLPGVAGRVTGDITESEAAQILGVTPRYIHYLAATGRLKKIPTSTKLHLYCRSDIERVARERLARQEVSK